MTIHREKPKVKSVYASRIGLFNLLTGLFDLNEFNFDSLRYRNQWQTRPYTDRQLAEMITKHFPCQRRLIEEPPGKYYGFWPTVNYYRGRYNRGKLTSRIILEEIPLRPSFSYNSAGKRISGRSGIRVLTPSEIASILIQHQARLQSARQDAILCSTT